MADFSLRGSQNTTNWPLLLLIFIMPLINIQVQYIPKFGAGLNIVNLLLVLSVLYALFAGKKPQAKLGFNTLLIWYLLTSLFALVVGYNFLGVAAEGNINFMKDQLIPIVLVFVIQRSVLDMVQWRRVLVAVLLPLPYCFKVVWTQYQSVSTWHYSHDLRVSGTFMHLGANEMGAYSAMLALVCLGCVICCWNVKRWRLAFMAGFVFSGLCLLYSFSRGGYVAFLFGAIIILLKFKNTRYLLLPAFFIAVIAIGKMPVSVQERFTSISAEESERDASAESRFLFWDIAMKRFWERPFVGFGYKSVKDARVNPYEMDTHNYYIKMLVERGILGIITFLLVLWGFIKLINRNLDWEQDDAIVNGVMLGLSGAIGAILLGNVFGDRFSHYPIMTSFWALIALCTVIELKRREQAMLEDIPLYEPG